MFYVNPKGKYQKRFLQSDEKNQQKVQLTIQYILVIPPFQRSEKDHQQVFYYFKNHNFFTDIERLKSLRARILCTSVIQLMPFEQFQQKQFIVLQRFQKSKQIAAISIIKKSQIMQEDEAPIKLSMTKLKQYSLIKRLGYNQLLYLACFVYQFTPKYKEYLYKQNQQVNFIYLIESGQYQIVKNIQFNDQSLQNSRLRKRTSKSRLDQYVQFEQSPYKLKNKRIKHEDVYIVQGGSGQAIGETQFFLGKQSRIYSVKCNSSNNNIIKCPIKHFKMIFESNQKLLAKIKLEFQQRQVFQSKSIEVRTNLRQNKSKQKFNLGKYALQIQNTNQFKGFSLDLKNRSLIQDQYRNIGTIGNQQQKIQSPKNHRYFQQRNQNPQSQAFTLEDNLLPKIVKSNNNSQAKRKQKRFAGLIDSSFLIKEKESVFKRKYPVKKISKQIFDFDPVKNTKRPSISIVKSQKNSRNQNRNVAHSKVYMKNLLVDALKKSGYINEDDITQKICFNNDFQRQKLKYRVQKMSDSAHQHTYELIIQLQKKAQQEMQQRIRNEDKLLSKKQRRSLASNNFDRFFFRPV